MTKARSTPSHPLPVPELDEDWVLITYNVGNTHTTCATWNADAIVTESSVVPTAELIQDLDELIGSKKIHANAARSIPGQRLHIVISGVVPVAIERLHEYLTGCLKMPHIWRFREQLACPLQVSPKPAASVGDDRLAGALGALGVNAWNSCVFVDAGTAVTINAVRQTKNRKLAGIFEGGVIIPGEALMLQSLHAKTAQLPELPAWPKRKAPPAIGKSTQAAIQNGVRLVQLAAIARIAKEQAKILDTTVVWITGGNGQALLDGLAQEMPHYALFFDPHLVHLGLFMAWRRYLR